MKKIKIMSIFGTRPEAIKMAPLIKELEKHPEFESIVTVTGQHREMLDQVLEIFAIKPDFDMKIMSQGQTLNEITTRILTGFDEVFQQVKPDLLLVHGDTTTTFAASLAGFYHQVAIGHVEAGLRTWDKYSPFPEEMNRQLTDTLADLYFAPTHLSKENLLAEKRNEYSIFVTGNTAIDAMKYTIDEDYHSELLEQTQGTRRILVTMHRRENLGENMSQVFGAIKKLAEDYPDVSVIFPMHKNPEVRKLAQAALGNNPQVQLIEPLDAVDFQNVMKECYLILTDSGGIQEEAPALGVPVLVLRDTTERPEGVSAGTVDLIGTNEAVVYQKVSQLLTNQEAYDKMAHAENPYGDGKASQRIVQAILSYFDENKTRPADFGK